MICTKCKNKWDVDETGALGNCPKCGSDTLMMLNTQMPGLLVQDILKNMVLVHGIGLLNDQRRLLEMLEDSFHHDKRINRLLKIAVKYELPRRLHNILDENSTDIENKISVLRKNIQEMAFLSDAALDEMFQYWIIAINSLKSISTTVHIEDGEWIDRLTYSENVKYSADRRKLIGGFVFRYSIIEGTEVICDNAFSGKDLLFSINIPSSVVSIGNNAFYFCEGLTRIDVPSSVKSIGRQAFSMCSKMQDINLPDSVTSIGPAAFEGCGLIRVTIPSYLSTIDELTFASCGSLGQIVLPKSIKSIGKKAFAACKRLSNVILSESLITIGEMAFLNCSLESILICFD
jgi:DNA-directed RNA polymerase subunit RPC12/RpoP